MLNLLQLFWQFESFRLVIEKDSRLTVFAIKILTYLLLVHYYAS